jgi:poly(A) polymerase
VLVCTTADGNIEKSKSVDISWASQEFYDFCKSWQSYSEDTQSIYIRYTRNFELPEDVFLPGESRPVKPTRKKIVKRKAMNSTNGTSMPLKRPAEQALESDAKRPRATSISHAAPIQA